MKSSFLLIHCCIRYATDRRSPCPRKRVEGYEDRRKYINHRPTSSPFCSFQLKLYKGIRPGLSKPSVSRDLAVMIAGPTTRSPIDIIFSPNQIHPWLCRMSKVQHFSTMEQINKFIIIITSTIRHYNNSVDAGEPPVMSRETKGVELLSDKRNSGGFGLLMKCRGSTGQRVDVEAGLNRNNDWSCKSTVRQTLITAPWTAKSAWMLSARHLKSSIIRL